MAPQSRSEISSIAECDGNLPVNEVHVWQTKLELPTTGSDALLRILARDELERYQRFKADSAQREFLLAHVFSRLVLGRYLGKNAGEIEFQTTAHGKPQLATNVSIRFNLSHSGGVALLAVARDGDVGVDVERIRSNIEPLELADRFFSPRETEWLRSQNGADLLPAFFACWTAKEAYVKARGEGLSVSLGSFAILPQPGRLRLDLDVNDDLRESGRWSVWQLELGPELRGAVAVEGEDCKIRLGQWQLEYS